MKNFSFYVLLLLSKHLIAQNFDRSYIQFSNFQTNEFGVGVQINFEYQYLEHAPDSFNLTVEARLKAPNQKEVVVSSPVYFSNRPKSERSGYKTVFFDYRKINLNAGSHSLLFELELTDKKGYRHQLASSSIMIQQPKRYAVMVEVNGGQVAPMKPSGKTWDSASMFSLSKHFPDPQWWMYIESTFQAEPSVVNKNSLSAPSARFDLVVLHNQKLFIKLFDNDGIVNSDDLIGSFRVHHPNELMSSSLRQQNANHVTGFNVNMKKELIVVRD